MTRDSVFQGWIRGIAGLLAGLTLLAGCRGGRRIDPVSIPNPRLGSMTIAVAPALNLSGSAAFDRNRFADLMASELGYADGIGVIPVSRVLGILASQGREEIESPTHALELVELLGADAILVFAVTEYDPYDPPSIGISAQLYGKWSGARRGALDPLAVSRQARLSGSLPPAPKNGLLAQSERVFDASHESVTADVRQFARFRGADGSPYGWRKYLVSQRHYIRYCCHATVRALFGDMNEAALAESETQRVGMP